MSNLTERARAWIIRNRRRVINGESEMAIQSLTVLLIMVYELGKQDGIKSAVRPPSSGRISVADEVEKIMKGQK